VKNTFGGWGCAPDPIKQRSINHPDLKLIKLRWIRGGERVGRGGEREARLKIEMGLGGGLLTIHAPAGGSPPECRSFLIVLST